MDNNAVNEDIFLTEEGRVSSKSATSPTDIDTLLLGIETLEVDASTSSDSPENDVEVKQRKQASDTHIAKSSCDEGLDCAVKKDEFLRPSPDDKDEWLLDFPVTIDIKDIVETTPSNKSVMSSINAHSMQDSSVQSSVERNKKLCFSSGRTNLTAEEEERVSAMLLENEEDEEYGCMPTIDEEREAELDSLLHGLGYDVDDANGDQEAGQESDDQTLSNISSRRDPVLCELEKNRQIKQHEKSIDRALRSLLREPLPPVIHIPDGDYECTKGMGTDVSLLSSFCAESTLTTPVTEHDLKQLIKKAKEEIEEDDLKLADHKSVRELAQSIIDEESSKVAREFV